MLELELDDATIDKVLNMSLREIQRYIDSTKVITIPYEKCIDLNQYEDKMGKVNSITNIYRAVGYTTDTDSQTGGWIDPMQASQWQILAGIGNIYNFQDFAYNYMSWNTLLQLRNTMSTDLTFRYDKSTNKLYINVSTQGPGNITIEYVPRYDSVEEIDSDYWIDMLLRLAVAQTKITVGRIRSRYTQTNALWTQDGKEILEEGTSELNALREYLAANTQLMYPVD